MPLQFLSPIHKASRQIGIYLERATIELRVSPGEGHMLSYLRTYVPCPLSELERVFGHKRSTLTSMLDRLSDRGLLTRHINPDDRRSFTIELTPDGRKLAGKLQKVLEAFEHRVKERINDKQMAGFRSVMEAIADVTHVKVREREV